MHADAAVDGGPGAAIDEYVTFCIIFEDEDRVDLYMGGDPTCLLKQIDGFTALEAARAAALEWVGSKAGEYDFHHMPGIYQTAFVKFINGFQADSTPWRWRGIYRRRCKTTLCWCVTSRQGLSRHRSRQNPAGCRG